MPELIGLPYSPWSEKARWAIEVRGVPCRHHRYSPLIGEIGLRAKLGRWRGPVTVPLLVDDDGTTYPDSVDIARWADARGAGPTLFPEGAEAEVSRFVDLSERGLAAGRALSLERVVADRDALLDLVPSNLRGILGSLGPRIAAAGIRRTQRKYATGDQAAAAHRATFVAVLEEIRSAIGSRRDAPLLGELTFADIAATQVLAYVEPPSFGLRLGPASRRVFADQGLAKEYRDVVAWRDAVYEAHRPR